MRNLKLGGRGQEWLRIAGLVPVIALALAAILLAVFQYRGQVFEPPNLAFVLHFIFVFCVGILLAMVSSKAYLKSGSLSILIIGMAATVSGALLIIAQWALTPDLGLSLTPNQAVTMANTGFLLASLFIFAAGLVYTNQQDRTSSIKARRTIVGAAYMAVLLLIAIVISFCITGSFPLFFTSEGPTAWRQAFLGITGIFVILSSVLFVRAYLLTRSPILYWYTLGLISFGVTLIGTVYTFRIGDPSNWCARIGLYLMGLFFIMAVLSRDPSNETTSIASERWAKAFRNDKDLMSTLFSKMLNGFAYCRIITDRDGKPQDFVYLDVNSAFERNHNLLKENIIGRRATEVLPGIERDPADLIGKFGCIATSGETADFEAFSQTENKWFHYSVYSPVTGYFVSTSEDITESKRSQAELRESEAKYRSLFDSTTEAIALEELIYDDDGVVRDYYFRDVNPPWEKMFEKTKEEVIGRTAKQVFGVVEDYWVETFVKVVETGRPLVIDQYSAALDRYYSVNAWKISERTCAIGVIEITAIKKAQKVAQEERDRLNSLISSMTDEVWLVDSSGKIIMANPAAMKEFDLTMTSEGLEVGKIASSYEAYRADGSERPLEEAPPSRALKGEVIRNEVEIVRTPVNSEIRYRQVSASPVRGAEGEIIGSVSVVRDITDQIRKENELKRSNTELQQFAYLSSHDLQEPLRMMLSYLSLLDKRYRDKLDPQGREYVNNALEGGGRMRQLIDDLLEYSRLDSIGKEFKPVNMNEVLDSTIKLLKVPIEESKADLFIGPLPTIMGDEAQILQLMQNLVGNSIKFRGSDRPMVRVMSEQGPRSWTFKVKDNGIGLNEEYADKIFQMFQRLHNKDKYPGTGIGLAIAKKIVERHGGNLWVESEEGNGATFFFTIPREGSI